MARTLCIDLFVHKVPRERHRFGSLQTAGFDSEPRLGRTCFLIAPRENSERLEQAVMIEAPIDHSRVISIPEQVVDPINTKCVTDDNFGQNVSQTVKVTSGANSESFFGPIAIFAT
jgi:hypothetical protein